MNEGFHLQRKYK